MKAKNTATPSPPPEMSRNDKDLLANAYKSGLISSWKMDGERRYRVTLSNQRDEYVEGAMLTTYLEGLRKKLL